MASICMAFMLLSSIILLKPDRRARTLRAAPGHPTRRRHKMTPIRRCAALAVLCVAATAAWAQQPPAEEPGWAKGRPKTDAAARMAPVPAFPIPTAADQLPTARFKLPPGFKVETWASGVLDARALRQGAKGNVFVSTLFVGNKVYAIPEK